MAKKKKRTAITTDHVISTLVYIRNLTDALIATLMAGTGTDFSQLPPPLSMDVPYEKDCPSAEDKEEPPPYDKDCPPREEPTPTRFVHCPTLVVKVPKMSVAQANKPKKSRK